MNRYGFFILLLLGMPCVAVAECTLDPRTLSIHDCPPDAKVFLERIAACQHFAGEHTGGSSPERDKEVNAEFERLHCTSDHKGYETEEFWRVIDKYRFKHPYEIYFSILETLNKIDPEFILNIAHQCKPIDKDKQ